MSPTRISHYRLVERLGAGTYGEVWRGVHTQDSALGVAVKLLHPALAGDPVFLASLKSECRLLAALQHPNIVGFRDLVLSDSHPPAMVMELVAGGSLEQRLATGPQPVPVVASILSDVLSGLAHAHDEDVVHRDIKPGNVLVDTRGRARLADFGIARAADGGQATKTGAIQGTLDYLAPEVFQGKKAGPGADLYALGLVAWELLAGRRACPDGPLGAKMGWHIGVGLPDVRTVRPDCPAWLAELIAALGARDAALRPVGARAALKRIEATPARAAPPVGTPPAVGSGPSTVAVSRDAPSAEVVGRSTVVLPELEPEDRKTVIYSHRPGLLYAQTHSAGDASLPRMTVDGPRGQPESSVGVEPPPVSRESASSASVDDVDAAWVGKYIRHRRNRWFRTGVIWVGAILLFIPIRMSLGQFLEDAYATVMDASVATDEAVPAPDIGTPGPGTATTSAKTSTTDNDSEEATGLLTVSSVPRAQVVVDGRYVRYSPLFRYEVAAGERIVTLVTDDGRQTTFALAVPEDGEARRVYSFEDEAFVGQ